MTPQVPSEPWPFFAAEHAWQNPVQVVLQQTPSTQLSPRQSQLRAHVPPFAWRSKTSARLVTVTVGGRPPSIRVKPPATSTA
jgi:hypothetical protein